MESLTAMHKPKQLPDETLERIEATFEGTGYMDEVLFNQWLRDFIEDIKDQKCKIVLLIDSVPGHCRSDRFELSNITIVHLHPNTMSVTQPLDTGIIQSFKALYSQELLQLFASHQERARAPKAPTPNGPFWTCIANA